MIPFIMQIANFNSTLVWLKDVETGEKDENLLFQFYISLIKSKLSGAEIPTNEQISILH